MEGTENTSAEEYVDKTVRCRACLGWVERLQPHPGSQGVATWRHVIPADHVAQPVEGKREDSPDGH